MLPDRSTAEGGYGRSHFAAARLVDPLSGMAASDVELHQLVYQFLVNSKMTKAAQAFAKEAKVRAE